MSAVPNPAISWEGLLSEDAVRNAIRTHAELALAKLTEEGMFGDEPSTETGRIALGM